MNLRESLLSHFYFSLFITFNSTLIPQDVGGFKNILGLMSLARVPSDEWMSEWIHKITWDSYGYGCPSVTEVTKVNGRLLYVFLHFKIQITRISITFASKSFVIYFDTFNEPLFACLLYLHTQLLTIWRPRRLYIWKNEQNCCIFWIV